MCRPCSRGSARKHARGPSIEGSHIVCLNKTLKHLVIVMAVIVLATSCATDSSLDLRLVSRVSTFEETEFDCDSELHCHGVWLGLTFRDVDGVVVVNPDAMRSWQVVSDSAYEVECDGVVSSAPSGTSFLDDFEVSDYGLVFEDDSTLALLPDTAIFVHGDCYDERGRWQGTAGSYLGHSGTYRLTKGTLQFELNLSSLEE
jgi:hypothetical protein